MLTIAKRAAPPIALLLAAGIVWELYVDLMRVPNFLLPGPIGILEAAGGNRALLTQNAAPTMQIAVLGFLLALVSGVALSVAIHLSRLLETTLYPIVIASQTVPVLALAPVLVIIFGFTIVPKLIIVTLICFFPITVNAVDGFKSVDPDLVRLMRSFGAGHLRVFLSVEWPSALPFIFSGAKVAVTYSVIGALFAEYAGSFEGLGHLMSDAQAEFETDVLFAAIGVLSLIGIGLFVAVSVAERLLLPWYHTERRNAVERR